MARNKKPRHPQKQPRLPKVTKEADNFPWTLMWANRIFRTLGMLPLFFMFWYVADYLNQAGGLFFMCVITATLISFFQLVLMRTAPIQRINPRSHMVIELSLSIFSSFVLFIPIFYVEGIIRKVMGSIPGLDQLGTLGAVVVSFLLGAALSGVVGNFTYDVLKYLVAGKSISK